jgi:CubicO group peptidase (beta-lactamase class C family)
MSNRKIKSISLSVLVIAMHLTALAQPDDPIDQYIQTVMKERQIPGLALLIARDGKIVRAKGYGFSNVELQAPVKPETLFQSGSMGKQFTATAVMKLVEQGKVQLDDPLTKYFKDAPPSWKNVTVRELLSHTGGFTDYPKNFNFHLDRTEDELLKVVESLPLAFPPGTKWSYANLGYLTLGVLIHRVSGQFYGDFLRDQVFEPLGMTTTRIINEDDIIPNRAAGYRLVKRQLKNQEWVSPLLNTTADGSLYFSILDLAKWDASLYTEKFSRNQASIRCGQLLSSKTASPIPATTALAGRWIVLVDTTSLSMTAHGRDLTRIFHAMWMTN